MSIKIILVLSLLSLNACGFSPMYGTVANSKSGAVEEKLSQVEIDIIPDREGQFLRNQLIDRFYRSGMPRSAPYALKVAPLNESISDYDITVESEATRRQLRITTAMTLIDTNTGNAVLQRSLQSITSHNVLESEFSTLVTEQSAREAALNDLARQIERHVSLYLGS